MTDGFEFLGFHVTMRWDKRYGYGPRVEIPKAGAADLRRKVKQLTKRNTVLVSLGAKLQELNPILRGWANYYRHCAYAGRVFTSLSNRFQARPLFRAQCRPLGRAIRAYPRGGIGGTRARSAAPSRCAEWRAWEVPVRPRG